MLFSKRKILDWEELQAYGLVQLAVQKYFSDLNPQPRIAFEAFEVLVKNGSASVMCLLHVGFVGTRVRVRGTINDGESADRMKGEFTFRRLNDFPNGEPHNVMRVGFGSNRYFADWIVAEAIFDTPPEEDSIHLHVR